MGQDGQRPWHKVETQKPSAGKGTRRLRNTDTGLWAVGHMDLGHHDPDRPDLWNGEHMPA